MGTMLAKLEREPPTPEANFEVPSELGQWVHGFFVAPRDDGFNGQRMRFGLSKHLQVRQQPS